VGHLYNLQQKEGKKWEFPLFDIEWQPSHKSAKGASFTKKYLDVLKKLAKEADEFTIATDLDNEGEVIGLNVMRYACKQKDANRMKFSTLTKDDLIEAYEHKSPSIEWGLAKAGEARHYLDWYNGINYSRALTHSIKAAGSFKIMSTGRVQGPALKIIVDREKEIEAFKPEPYWQIELNGEKEKQEITVWHSADKFWDRSKADEVMSKVKGQKTASVSSIEKKQFRQSPPTPFDLTSMQVEAYRLFRIPPKETLEIAQELYTSGVISYPRTSSQKLPDKIGYKKVLNALAKNDNYSALAKKLLSLPSLKPNEGKKSDPAHPAIYPTGSQPRNLKDREAKVYDLVVKRFLATFAEPAVRETMTTELDCNTERFIAKGTRTAEKNWHEFYAPYVKLEEAEFPVLEKNDIINVRKITMHDKETQPPKRYTPASIISELEKRNLGTKATRASIIDTLFHRNYVDGTPIKPTGLGIKTLETLEKHAPRIIDEELTRSFELDMENIEAGKQEPEQVLSKAKAAITDIIADFRKKEKEIGNDLKSASIETRDELATIGKCPECKEKDLQIRRGKFGMFVACSGYPDCKTTFSLPSNAKIVPAKKECEKCGFPMVSVIKRAKRPQEICINPKCETKQLGKEAEKVVKDLEKGNIEKKCPKCGKNLVARKSLYGAFLGCSGYPKCRYTEKLEN